MICDAKGFRPTIPTFQYCAATGMIASPNQTPANQSAADGNLGFPSKTVAHVWLCLAAIDKASVPFYWCIAFNVCVCV